MDTHVLQALIAHHGPAVGPSAQQFLERVFAKDLAVYETRLRQYGLGGYAHVLDAGCGFGQWSLALSTLNQRVSACDVSDGRVAFLRDAVKQLGVPSVDVRQAALDALPYPDGQFDAAFCYGVIFLTPWRESLRELVRVLKPGGRLYVNANGFGWYKHLWYTEHNRGDGYDPKGLAARALQNTLAYERQSGHVSGTDVIIEPRDLIDALTTLGCVAIEQGAEGMLGAPGARAPFFAGEYLGDLGVYEVLCRKADATDTHTPPNSSRTSE